MATGSTITGGSSISVAVVALGLSLLVASGDRDESLSLSLLPRNLLPLRILGDVADGESSMPDTELEGLSSWSLTDFERSLFCFWKNFGSFEGACWGEVGDGVCLDCLLDMYLVRSRAV